MGSPLSDRRQIENEVVFRESNERVQKELEDLKKIAEEEHDEFWAQDSDKYFDFFCECSDENCRQPISLKPSLYKEIHNNRNQFIIIPGHQAVAIEKIIFESTNDYTVVEKYDTPPEQAEGLKPTDIDNT